MAPSSIPTVTGPASLTFWYRFGQAIVNGQAQIKFSASANQASSFRLLNAVRLSGPWTTNTAAVLSTNAAGDSFTLAAPLGGSSATFYRVQSSAGQ